MIYRENCDLCERKARQNTPLHTVDNQGNPFYQIVIRCQNPTEFLTREALTILLSFMP